jgi:hypothetical protein
MRRTFQIPPASLVIGSAALQPVSDPLTNLAMLAAIRRLVEIGLKVKAKL